MADHIPSTPADHLAAVGTFRSRLLTPGLVDPQPSRVLRAEVDAILATKAGTGPEYINADYQLLYAGDNILKLTAAKLAAILADPA